MSETENGQEVSPTPKEADSENEIEIKVDNDTPPADAAATPTAESLAAKVEEKAKEAQNNLDRLMRITADFENYKKRVTRETEEFRKFANETIIKELLPVVDNLERAIESAQEEAQAHAAILEGVTLTLDGILDVFNKFGVIQVEALGKDFDPNYHQAIQQEMSEELAPNTVTQVFQKGYVMHDRLIRPAMVVVSKAAAAEVKKTVTDQGESKADT
jgi:molecular chaperone GrpE